MGGGEGEGVVGRGRGRLAKQYRVSYELSTGNCRRGYGPR